MADFIVTKVGEFIFSKLLETLYENLAVPKFWDFVRGQGLQENLDKWRTTLPAIQKMLDDAEEKQYTDTDVKEWLDDLRHLIYDVDDIVDELTTKASTTENEARPSKVPKLTPSAWFTPRYFEIDSRLRSKIKEVTDGLNDILTRKGQLNLKETGDGRSHMKTGVQAPTSVLTEPQVYGRKKDIEAVLELLLGEKCSEAGVSVIPILGMGGIGKTTLAQFLFNDEKVQSFFDPKAWACVSEDFDTDRVTKAILQSLTHENCDGKDRNWLQVKLKERLNGKKFLVVLDDLWNENYQDWTILLAPFLTGAPGSKIIITTRNEKVSLMTSTIQPRRLQVLSKDDCLSLFTQHALGAGDFSADRTLEDIGEKIVEKCQGLPLAAKTLGGLLRTTRDRAEWEEVLKSKIWDISEKSSGILPALMLSYHHLPSHLKRCFAYCSIFSKDYEFEEKHLVLLWMAEGLIQSQDGDKQMEDLGSKYFRDLLSRSFFNQSSMKISRFVMHDLINDLAKWVAGDTCFRIEDQIGDSDGSVLLKKARHSSYLCAKYDTIEKLKVFFEPSFELKCLRTFLPLMLPWQGCYLTHNVPLQLLPKLLCLRVLSLSGYYIVELPDSIGDLKHLRYFDLSYTQIRGLPESTTTLYNLQTLILENCFYLKELPSKLGNLVNLRHLNILNAKKLEGVPPQIGKLTFLHTLSNLIVGKDNYSVLKEVGSLLHLRGTLIISRLENAIRLRNASDAKLIEKLNLTELHLEWSVDVDDSQDRTSELEVLNMLQPNEALKELTISWYGGTQFSTWLKGYSFSHMVLLRIENCKKCTSLPPVGQLPSLEQLFIVGMTSVKNVDKEFYGNGSSQSFSSLKILHFEDMKEWENWSPNGGFPHLLEFFILRCPKLEKLPIRPSPSLKFISIEGMDNVKNIGPQFYGEGCSQPFGSLEILQFKDMKEWENWRPNGEFPHLSTLCITNCPKLLGELPNHLPSLKNVRIHGCQGLRYSISRKEEVFCRSEADFSLLMSNSLSRLILNAEVLSFTDSEEMTHLSSNVLALLQLLPSLRVLRFDSCQKLVYLVAEEVQEQPHVLAFPSTLREINISCCKALESLPKAVMYNNTCLEKITIVGCDSLKHFAIDGCQKLVSLVAEEVKEQPHVLAFPSTLREIDISYCRALESLPKAVVYNNTCLEKIKIAGCDSLKRFAIGQLPQTLKRLEISFCNNMVILLGDDDTNSRSSSTSLLEYLEIQHCPSLKSLGIPMGELPATLKVFTIRCCEKLESIAESFHPDSCLEKIVIECCENLKSLPMGIHTLNHLEKVSIFKCPSLVSLPDRGLLPDNIKELWISELGLHDSILSITSLQHLTISNSNNIEALIEWGLHRLTSLKSLKIDGCPNLVSFPEKMLPASLIKITIERFHDLKLLSSKGFQNLASLKMLCIKQCENLTSFPEDGLPPSLEILLIRGCPRLKEICKKDNEREWSKIAHIPCVKIDGRFIFDSEGVESDYDNEGFFMY
jgi:Leucine-rich repeat (LRR) protein